MSAMPSIVYLAAGVLEIEEEYVLSKFPAFKYSRSLLKKKSTGIVTQHSLSCIVKSIGVLINSSNSRSSVLGLGDFLNQSFFGISGIASTYSSSASLATLSRFRSSTSIGITCSYSWILLSADTNLLFLEVLDVVLPSADSLDFEDFIDGSASFLVLLFFIP
ncbi:hypothetical protein Tco_1301718 [Tanacetum coccineum]